MKFVVDESTGKGVAKFLKEEDYDTVYIGTDDKGIEDSEIMKKAVEENRIIITNDKDFGELAIRQKRKSKGILILRLQIETPENKIKTIKNVLEEHKDKLENNLVIAKENQIKTRNLN